MRHQSSLPQHKYEKLIMIVLIKVGSLLQFHVKLYRYFQRNVWALADNEVKTE